MGGTRQDTTTAGTRQDTTTATATATAAGMSVHNERRIERAGSSNRHGERGTSEQSLGRSRGASGGDSAMGVPT